MSELEPIPPPARAAELSDAALDWLHSTFARKVALYLAPVLLPVIGALAFWLEDKVGIDMDPAEATGFVVAVVLGLAGVLIAFVLNHGKGAAQLGMGALEIEKLFEAGRGALEGTTYYGGPVEIDTLDADDEVIAVSPELADDPAQSGAMPESPE
jgi:hypothetical protein